MKDEGQDDGIETLLPWQRSLWQELQDRVAQDRLPHALLIAGPGGVGKTRFARLLAQSLFCASPDQDRLACGACRPCRQFQAGSHPDWRETGIEAKRKNILIEQIRGVSAWLSLTASEAGRKIALVEPAERMTTGAANSLLKTLEEPPGDSLLLLLTALPGRLPATIRSRCQQLRLPAPAQAEALEWLHAHAEVTETEGARALALAGNSPLQALALLENDALARAGDNAAGLIAVADGRQSVVRLAEQWVRQDAGELLAWWRLWLEALIRRLHAGEGRQEPLLDPMRADLQKISRRIDWKALHELLSALQQAERRLDSANPQLLLESLLSQWARACGLAASGQHKNEVRA